MLMRDLIDKPLTNSWIGLPRVRRIREALISIDNQRGWVWQLILCNPKRRPRFAQQPIGRKRGSGGLLRNQNSQIY